MSVAERKYAMTRIGPGDYILPDNDGATLWRIYSYDEDGSTGIDRGGKFWAAAKFDTWIALNEPMPHDFLEWHRWQPWETMLATRQEALAAVLAE